MDFKFRFKDLQNESITYYATYTKDGDLEISVRKLIDLEDHPGDKSESRKITTLNGEEAWQAFYNNCTFEDILKSIDYQEASFGEIDINFQLEGIGKLEGIEEEEKKYKEGEMRKVTKYLRQISNFPSILGVSECTSVFINILEAARWGGTEDRKLLKNALKDNLTPQHPGGEKTKLCNPGLAKKLLKALAESLFQKLKDELKRQRRWESKTDWIESWDSETYELVRKWSAKNEKRLYLKEQDLKWLIESPASYADHLICSKFDISKRTVERVS